MTIKKYTGKTKEEAINKAKEDLGEAAVIMNVKETKKGGFLGMGKKKVFEVTASIDEDIDTPKGVVRKPVQSGIEAASGHFDAVADQEIKIPTQVSQSDEELEETKKQFAALSEIFRNNENNMSSVTYSKVNAPTKDSALSNSANNVIKQGDIIDDKENKKGEKKSQILQSKEEQLEEMETTTQKRKQSNNNKFVKTLYNTLLDNEVDEKYINQLMDDMEKVLKNGNNVNYLISNVYQKLILKLGQPAQIVSGENKPKVVFFIGSTGVGKTTTIAKIASDLKLKQGKEIALVTMDTYRLGAKDQLEEYASIMQIPMKVILEPEQISEEINKLKKYEVVLVDTSGFSHRNNEMKGNVVSLLNSLDEKFEKEVYLVLSATTKYKDLKEIIDSYKEFTTFNMIFTKLDETSSYGNILNCKLYSKSNLSYVTTGQNVPDDIEILDTQKLVKYLLGGNN